MAHGYQLFAAAQGLVGCSSFHMHHEDVLSIDDEAGSGPRDEFLNLDERGLAIGRLAVLRDVRETRRCGGPGALGEQVLVTGGNESSKQEPVPEYLLVLFCTATLKTGMMVPASIA